MADWLSYSLQDFLLFSPKVYWRFLADYLAEQNLVSALFVMSTALFWWPKYRDCLINVVLAASWIILGWNFYLNHYAVLNPMVVNIAYSCLVLAGLFMFNAGLSLFSPVESSKPKKHLVLALFIILLPVAMQISFESWQAGVLGIHPVPTSLLSLIFLLTNFNWRHLFFAIIPAIILIIELLTLVVLI